MYQCRFDNVQYLPTCLNICLRSGMRVVLCAFNSNPIEIRSRPLLGIYWSELRVNVIEDKHKVHLVKLHARCHNARMERVVHPCRDRREVEIEPERAAGH